MTWRHVTGLVIVGAPVLVGAYDVLAYVFGGNEATISRVLLDAGTAAPAVPAAVGVLAGALVAHFFLRQTDPPEGQK